MLDFASRATPICRCNPGSDTPFCAPCTAAIAPGTMRPGSRLIRRTNARCQRSVPTSCWAFPARPKRSVEESFAFIAAQPFTYLHLFPFSPRPWNQRRGSSPASNRCFIPAGCCGARWHGCARTNRRRKTVAFRQSFMWAARCLRSPCIRPRPRTHVRLPTTFLEVRARDAALAGKSKRVHTLSYRTYRGWPHGRHNRVTMG